MQSVTSNAVKSELNSNYRKIIQLSVPQSQDYITRFDISAYLTDNCKLSIDIFTVIDGYKESVAKVMITRYNNYEVYLYIVYNSNEAYPITLENGILIAGNGNAYTYGGIAFVTYL